MKGRIDVELSLECDQCGGDLTATISETTITVQPCKSCMGDECDRGKEAAEKE